MPQYEVRAASTISAHHNIIGLFAVEFIFIY